METQNKIISGLLAIVILGALIFSGATTALDINVNPDNSVEEGETADIEVGIDLNENEHVPFKFIGVIIKSANSDSYDKFCAFRPNGKKMPAEGNFKGCEDVFGEISAENVVPYEIGYGYGYGYGLGYDDGSLVYGNEGVYFDYGYGYTPGVGYGYGYGYGYSGANGELKYNVEWNAPEVSEDTEYDVTVVAFANDGYADWYTYEESGHSITVTNILPEEEEDDGRNRRPAWDDGEEEMPSVSRRHLNVEAGQSLSLPVDEKGLAVSNLKATANQASDAVELSVSKANKPEQAAEASNKVYQYLDINIDAEVSDVEVDFKVQQSWLEENNVAEAALYHYKDNSWDELEATVEESDDEYVYYTAKAESLSYFAIGEKTVEQTDEGQDQQEQQQEENESQHDDQKDQEQQDQEQQEKQETKPEKSGGFPVWLVVLGVVVVGGIIGGVYYTRKGQ